MSGARPGGRPLGPAPALDPAAAAAHGPAAVPDPVAVADPVADPVAVADRDSVFLARGRPAPAAQSADFAGGLIVPRAAAAQAGHLRAK